MVRFIVEYENMAKAEELRPDVEALSAVPELTMHYEMFPLTSIVVDRSEMNKTLKELESMPGVRQIWLDDVVIPQLATVNPDTWQWGLRTAMEIVDESFVEGWSERETMEAVSKVLASGIFVHPHSYTQEYGGSIKPLGPINSVEDIVKYVEADKCPNRGEDSIIVIFDTGVAKHAVRPRDRLAGYVPLGRRIRRHCMFAPKRGCFYVSDDPWRDWFGHGTMVTSIAYGAVDSGIEGVACEAKIVSVKVIGLMSEFIKGFEWIMGFASRQDKHVVVNMSWGLNDWQAPIPPFHPFVRAYAALALHPNVTVVNAAGNSGHYQQPTPFGAEMNTINTMGSIPWNICVGATAEDGYPQNLQNYSGRGGGRWGWKPDVVAPTHGVVGWSNWNGYGSQKIWMGNGGGTSAATPVVTGVAAIVASDLYDKGLLEKLGEHTSEVIKRKIITAADQLVFLNVPGSWSPRHGAGVVKALGAVILPPLGAVSQDWLTVGAMVGCLAAGTYSFLKAAGLL